MGTGTECLDLRVRRGGRSEPGRCAVGRLPRKRCERVEKLREVVLNRSDDLGSV